MNDVAWYATLKHLHLLTVAVSVSLFVTRWVGVLTGHGWPMHRVTRLTSMAIDTVLLSAGITLWALGGWHPWHTPWLGTKLLALLAYVLLGSWALKRAVTRQGKLVSGLAALGVVACMVGMAVRHHPASWWNDSWTRLGA